MEREEANERISGGGTARISLQTGYVGRLDREHVMQKEGEEKGWSSTCLINALADCVGLGR